MTRAVFRDFVRNCRANVAMIFAFAAIPLVFVVGMAIDYGAAARLKSKLNAAADAAALAATAPAMMTQSDAAAISAATNMFNAEVTGLSRLIFNGSDPTNLTVTVAHPGGNLAARNVTVTYHAQSQNVFGGILNVNTIAFGGVSTGSAKLSPDINFYVLADTSPSMAVAATTAGINLLQSKTLGQWGAPLGCAFACHEVNPAADNLGNPGGPNQDDYALAQSLGVTLRIDNLNSAVQALASTAASMQSTNNTTYNMAIYTFDANFNTITSMTTPSAAGTAAKNIKLLEIYQGGYLTRNSQFNPSENDTYSQLALSKINGIMPNPGTGLSANSPQEFLFLITDGVENDPSTVGLMSTSMCDTIKARGIQIGVVYTTYFPIPTYFPYQQIVQPIQSQIGSNLQGCASSAAYYYEVNTDQSIADALNAIFAKFIGSHLTQ